MPLEDLRRVLGVAVLLGLCAGIAGCASTGAPDDWLPLAEEAPTDVYGAWITVHLIDEGARPHLAGEFSVDFADSLGYRPPLAGELLAVDADSVFVLVGGRAGSCPVTAIGKQDVAKAQVAYFDPGGAGRELDIWRLPAFAQQRLGRRDHPAHVVDYRRNHGLLATQSALEKVAATPLGGTRDLRPVPPGPAAAPACRNAAPKTPLVSAQDPSGKLHQGVTPVVTLLLPRRAAAASVRGRAELRRG